MSSRHGGDALQDALRYVGEKSFDLRRFAWKVNEWNAAVDSSFFLVEVMECGETKIDLQRQIVQLSFTLRPELKTFSSGVGFDSRRLPFMPFNDLFPWRWSSWYVSREDIAFFTAADWELVWVLCKVEDLHPNTLTLSSKSFISQCARNKKKEPGNCCHGSEERSVFPQLTTLASTLIDVNMEFWIARDRKYSLFSAAEAAAANIHRGYRHVDVMVMTDYEPVWESINVQLGQTEGTPMILNVSQLPQNACKGSVIMRELLPHVEWYQATHSSPLKASEIDWTSTPTMMIAGACVELNHTEAIQQGLLPAGGLPETMPTVTLLDHIKRKKLTAMRIRREGGLADDCYRGATLYFSVPGHETVRNAAYSCTVPVKKDDLHMLSAAFVGLVSLSVVDVTHEACDCCYSARNDSYVRPLIASICEHLSSSPECTIERIEINHPDNAVYKLYCQDPWNSLVAQSLRHNKTVRSWKGAMVAERQMYADLAQLLRDNTTLETLADALFLTPDDPALLDPVIDALRESNTSLLYFSVCRVTGSGYSTHMEANVKFRKLTAEVLKNRSLDVRAREILGRLIDQKPENSTNAIDNLPDSDLYVLATVPRQRMHRYTSSSTDPTLAAKLSGRILDCFFRLTGVCRGVPQTTTGKPILTSDCWRSILKYLRVVDVATSRERKAFHFQVQ